MSEEVKITVQSSPREDLIRTAVSFLSNPNVQKSPLSQKEAFLRKKGLTSEEIKLAFDRSSNHIISIPAVQETYVSNATQLSTTEFSWFQKFKDILHTLTLLVGASYGIYYIYKKFIEPFLFGKPKKPKAVEHSINNLSKALEKSVTELKNDMQKVQYDIDKVFQMQKKQQSSSSQINELKSEISTVKGILLSRHQFSSVNLLGPSIPAWQLTQSSHKDDKESLENDDAEHNSGSSETEVVPNPNSNNGSQGSDSSSEMIQEVDP